MQSKGAVRFLAIALAIVCLYQLSFTLVASYWDNKIHTEAAGDSAREKVLMDSMATAPAYNLLVKKFTLNEVRENEINLGLDLKGGMNVTLEVSLADLIRSLSNYSKDGTFNRALDEAQRATVNSQKDFVDLFYDSFRKLDPNARLSAIFATKDLQNRINLSSSNEDVLKVIHDEANNAFDRTYQIIKTRIDKFGVTSPNVQKLAGNRILVELPGIKEPDRVRKLLQGTAKLEFWETFENKDIYPILDSVNKMLKVIAPKDAALASSVDSLLPKDTTLAKTPADTSRSIEDILGKTTAKDSDSTASAAKDTTKQKTFEQFAQENPLFAYLTPSYFQNEQQQTELQKGPVIGIVQIKDTSRINAILRMEAVKARFPKEFKALWMVKPLDKEGKYLQLVAIRMPSRDHTAPLEGDAITDARKQKGQFSNNWEIGMSMNASGAKTWKRLTRENIGKSIAIVLDENVYSYPTVQGEIGGGNSQITGNFSLNEAEDLANILKVGKLPAQAKIVEEAIVGPTLGQEAISNSLISFIIAFVVILLFMGFYYMRAGWVANLALFANIFFIMGVLASLHAVLTLPGIAGIVLTIGLSVDANILIFERVREELRHGKGIRLAIGDGYKHAMSSILDSNITLLILGVVLYLFGSGPIQGFATTLVIGILCSLFAAVLISRLIFESLLAKNKPISFANNFSENLYKGIHFDFVKNRKKYYIFSSIVIIAGIVAFSMKGLNYGVDFKGGRTYVVQMDKSLRAEDLRLALAKPLESAPEVKTVGTENRFKITTSYLINDTASNTENVLIEKLHTGLAPLYKTPPDLETFRTKGVISSQKVGPTIADDIKHGAVLAILISCGLMFVYIFVRFKKWQFGLGATVALFHDVLFVLSLFAIFNGVIPIALEIDQHFIAAILTVMGYTMTESVVVFDRIREFLGVHHTADDKTVINEALNATLSRTINTTLTVFFVLVVIFIFGGEVIRGFIFALLIGRVIGTYSSLCISTPIVIDFQKKKAGELTRGMATPPKAAVKEPVH
jgi:SecD/SecF fusion protein